MKTTNQAIQNALVKAQEEFDVLTLGKENLTAGDILKLREHARQRTDLSQPDESLTPDQLAWKKIFQVIDSKAKEQIPEDEIQALDATKTELDEIKTTVQNLDKFKILGRQIEEALIMELGALLASSPHCGEKSDYFLRYDSLSEAMLNKSTTNDERVKNAEQIIKLIDLAHKWCTQNLFEAHDRIYQQINEMEKLIQTICTSIEKNFNKIDASQREDLVRLKDSSKNWLEMTQELYRMRTMAITAVKRRFESDLILPKNVLFRKGDISKNLDDDEVEKFKSSLASSATLFITSTNKEKEIGQKREILSKGLFGAPEDYMSLGKEKATDIIKPIRDNQPQNPLQGKAWFRLAKVLYILTYFFLGLIVFAMLVSGESEFIDAAIWTAIIGIGIMIIIKKGFYYIVLGKTSWKK
ncbi:MAG: hypothetical protein PHC53_04245 [Patescibacteria group bacterium]|nr:hypothetical protein [Patescibacteria group bacterium]